MDEVPLISWEGGYGSWFGPFVAGCGDVDGDGFDDIAMTEFDGNTSAMRVVPGSDQGPLGTGWLLPLGGMFDGPMASVLDGAGDYDGDGYDDVVIGMPGQSGGALGIAFGSPNGPRDFLTFPSRELGFGGVVAGLGDVDGDGFDDVAVSDPGAVEIDVWVFHGRPDRALVPSAPLRATVAGEALGWAVAGAGDVNGDGLDDVVVQQMNEAAQTGEVHVHFGSRTGLSAAPDQVLTSELPGPSMVFGFGLDAAGDVNGDGFADVVLGDYLAREESGISLVYLGSPAGLGAPMAAVTDGVPQAHNGVSVAGVGDVDGDAIDDIVVAQLLGDLAVGQFQVSANLFRGSRVAPLGLPAATFQPAWGSRAPYVKVAGAGDVFGDGLGSVLVANAVSVYLYHGDGSGRDDGYDPDEPPPDGPGPTCSPFDPLTGEPATDIWNDGIDQDCDGRDARFCGANTVAGSSSALVGAVVAFLAARRARPRAAGT